MALPSGPSPIQTAVLQLSRDLQQAFSKAKTSLSAVATQTRVAHTGSDSALPTSREGIFKHTRNLGSENIINSSSLLAALDVPRTSSLTALPDKAEEGGVQPEETIACSCEAPLATPNSKFGNVDTSRQGGFSVESRWAASVLPVSREAEKAEKKEFQIDKDDGGEEATLLSNKGRRHSDKSSLTSFCSQHYAFSSAPCAAVSVIGESTPATEQSRPSSTGQRKPRNSEEPNSTTKWLRFASPAGSSVSLLAQRGNNTASSLTPSVLSLSSSLPTPGALESAPGVRFPSQSSTFLETSPSPFKGAEAQNSAGLPYRRASTGVPSPQGLRALVAPDVRQHFQRKKLASPLACCSTGSSPCAPPLLPTALLSPSHQQRHTEKPLLLAQGAEKETVPSAYDSSYKNLETGSYTSVANPANSRLAEVENRWFLVDILGDVSNLIEEIPSQQQCFSSTDASLDSPGADFAKQQTQQSDLGTNEGSTSTLQRQANGSSTNSDNVVDVASSGLLSVGTGNSGDEAMRFLRCTLPAKSVEALSASAAEREPASDTRTLLTCLEKDKGEDDPVDCTSKPPPHPFNEGQEKEMHESAELRELLDESSQEQVFGRMPKAGGLQHLEEAQCEQQEEEIRSHSCRVVAQEQRAVEVLAAAAEVVNRLGEKSIPRGCSDGSIAGLATKVASSSACSSNSTAASPDFPKSASQQPLLHLDLRKARRVVLPSESQVLQHDEVRQRETQDPPLAESAVMEGVALLGAPLRSSMERSSGSERMVGRRRHRMQKAEGTTSFASLEAMVEFVRNSTSLYGTTALEGVTFHVPAEDAESLVSALEETLPYSWRDLRSAAVEALKPLTALVVGRFVLLQLPSLLLELAGGAAAENTAAAAAAAAAEASGLSAVLAIAPWLIVFGGCVYAIVRGAHALQASRRAQFLIYEDGEAETSRSQQYCQDATAVSLPGFSSPFVVDTPDAPSQTCVGGLAAVPADQQAADASLEIPARALQQAPVHVESAAGHLFTATQTSQPAAAEGVRAALGEQFESDTSEGSDGEEKHPLLDRFAPEEEADDVVGCGCSSSPMRGYSASRGGRSSRSSSGIVDLLSVAVSRRDSEDAKYDTTTGEHTNADTEDDLYTKQSDSTESGGGAWLESVRSEADNLCHSMRRSGTRVHRDSRDDVLQSSNSSERANKENKVLCVHHSHTKSSSAGPWPNASIVAGPSTTSDVVEEYVTVRRDRNRRSQEEDALQQQLLTCSADWREKDFSFEV